MNNAFPTKFDKPIDDMSEYIDGVYFFYVWVVLHVAYQILLALLLYYIVVRLGLHPFIDLNDVLR
jgi:hypothetical protein